jgi:cation:H+ antiporter
MDIITIFLFILGFALILGGADVLVRGAAKLAMDFGISPLVVGLTVVAYGTSAPELSISIQAMFEQQADISLGNVVGSNIANILLVLGIAALFRGLAVSRRIMKVDLPVMMTASIALFLFALDQYISVLEGAAFLSSGIIYTWYTIRKSRKEHKEIIPEESTESPASQIQKRTYHKSLDFALILVGFVMLIFGSNILVDSVVIIAEAIGVSKIIISLSVIAIGTSLPEVATTLVAGLKGEVDIAVGNAIGSNIMNILIVVGVASMVHGAGITVSSIVSYVDIPLMIGVALLCVAVIFNGFIIKRWEGIVFIIYFAFYLFYLGLRSTESQHLALAIDLFIYVLVPLTVLFLSYGIVKTIQLRKEENRAARAFGGKK